MLSISIALSPSTAWSLASGAKHQTSQCDGWKCGDVPVDIDWEGIARVVAATPRILIPASH
ncbi:hypothetical protein McPS_25330 [Marichromatium sp. PS1]